MTGRPRSTAPLRTKRIRILVTPELDALVTAAARKEGRSVSDWGQRLFERETAARAPRSTRLPLMSPEQQARMFDRDREIEAERRGGTNRHTKGKPR